MTQLDSLYEIRVSGERYFIGDEASIGVLVNNLSGENFNNKASPGTTHQGWLDYMVAEYQVPLPTGGEVALFSPLGVPMRKETIGGRLLAGDPARA